MANSISGLPAALESLAIKQTEKTKGKTLDQDAFLNLMVAQMNNQDPTKPLETGEFFSQLAQFGTVSGINQLQTSFQSLASALQSNQALQASTMVGRNVLVEGSRINLTSAGATVSGAVDLPQASGDVTLGVFNSAGQLVKTLSLGAQSAGLVQFTWEGLNDGGVAVPAGQYKVVAEAQIDGKSTAAKTLLEGKVESVTLLSGGAGPRLNLAGLGQIGIDAVREVR